MVQGRIEPTPAEQLKELRKARDRYAALAERLHDGADPGLDPEEALAKERDARRILHAYEKSIANSEVRMSSMGRTHRFARRSLSLRIWLMIFLVLSAVEGGMLLAYFRPAIFPTIFQTVFPQRGASKSRRATPNPVPVAALAKPIAPPQIAAPIVQPDTPPPEAAPVARPEAPAPAAAAPRPFAPPPVPLAAPKPVVQTPPVAASQPIVQPQTPPPVATAPVTPPPAAAATPPPLPAPSPPPLPQPLPQPNIAAAVPPPTRLEPIAGTHTAPPYPAASTGLGETGTTQIRLAISALGAVAECRIAKSSGSERLDAAACNHVQQYWRWKPATQGGQPVVAITTVTIVWNLRSAR
ncbi:MAG: energy transducer TonB [Rhizomicrobium sp.]